MNKKNFSQKSGVTVHFSVLTAFALEGDRDVDRGGARDPLEIAEARVVDAVRAADRTGSLVVAHVRTRLGALAPRLGTVPRAYALRA